MDAELKEALAELGLEHPSSSSAVRSAYLKLLKIRKPDQDPDGFRRLRHAYEVLQGIGAGSTHDTGSRSERTSPEPAPSGNEVHDHPEEPLEGHRKELKMVLEDLKLESFSGIKRIRILENFHQRYPLDEEVVILLAQALLELGFDDAATDLLNDFLRAAKGLGKIAVWRFMLKWTPGGVTRYWLLNPPTEPEPAEAIAAARLLLDRLREPTEAGRVLERLLTTNSAEAIAPHSDEVLRLIMSIGHAGFSSDVCRLAQAGSRLAPGDAGLLLEWLALNEKLPPNVMTQISWAIFARGQPNLTVEFDLLPPVLYQLLNLLDLSAPLLRGALSGSLPIHSPRAASTARTEPGGVVVDPRLGGRVPEAPVQQFTSPTGTPTENIPRRDSGMTGVLVVGAIVITLLLAGISWLFIFRPW